jgi:aminoglycoside phosphotransferase (APT) family kinase protein
VSAPLAAPARFDPWQQVPVAQVYAYCEDDGIVGAPFDLMEFLQGGVLTDLKFVLRQWADAGRSQQTQ